MRRFSTVWAALVVSVVAGVAGSLMNSPVDLAATTELVSNGGFESGTAGWRSSSGTAQPLVVVSPGRTSAHAMRLARVSGRGRALLDDVGSPVPSATAGEEYDVSAWVRASRPGVRGILRVWETSQTGSQRPTVQRFHLSDTTWRRVALVHRVASAGSRLDVQVLVPGLSRGVELLVDDVSMRRPAASEVPTRILTTTTSPVVPTTRSPAPSATPTRSTRSTTSSTTGATTRQAADGGDDVALGAQWHAMWADWDDDTRIEVLDRLKASGVTDLRMDLGWSMIQPKSSGAYDMGYGVPLADKALKMADDRGFDILVTFWLTPRWANDNAGNRVLPDNVNDYAKALKWAAARWKDEVHAWEIWNEPNSEAFLKPPDASAYTRLLKAAYPAVKAGNPSAKVVLGGPEYVNIPWLEKIYKAGGRGSFDIMAVHPYMSANPPETEDNGTIYRMAHTRALLTLMKSHSDAKKPIWFTEFGWSVHSNDSETPTWARGVTESQQADYLVRTLDYLPEAFPQVEKVFWYTAWEKDTDDPHEKGYGMIRRNMKVRPILSAVKEHTQNQS